MSTVLVDLWLVCAVNRYGLNNWHSVAAQLNLTCEGYCGKTPPFVSEGCRQRYLAIRMHFMNTGYVPVNLNILPDDGKSYECSNEESEKSMVKAMMEQFKQLRKDELVLDISRSDAKIDDLLLLIHEQSGAMSCVEGAKGTESSKDGKNGSNERSSLFETKLSTQDAAECVPTTTSNKRMIVCGLRAPNSSITNLESKRSSKSKNQKKNSKDGPTYNYS